MGIRSGIGPRPGLERGETKSRLWWIEHWWLWVLQEGHLRAPPAITPDWKGSRCLRLGKMVFPELLSIPMKGTGKPKREDVGIR